MWMSRFLEQCYGRMELFNAQELANTLFALQRLGCPPGERWLHR